VAIERGAKGPASALATQPAKPIAAASAAGPTAKTITGIIMDERGTPLAGAEVHIVSAKKSISMYNPDDRGLYHVVSGADGRYEIANPGGEFSVVVRSDDGYSYVKADDHTRGFDTRIQPWARVEGVVMEGAKIVGGATVTLDHNGDCDDWSYTGQQTSTKADANGHFVFAKVLAGEAMIGRNQEGSFHYPAHYAYTQVEPAGEATIQVGGVGRPVVGRIAPINDPHAVWAHNARHECECSVIRRDVAEKTQPPEHMYDLTAAAAHARRQFGQTEAGSEYMIWSRPIYGKVNSDGSFRVDDLPAGKYWLFVRTVEFRPEVGIGEDTSKVELTIQVPEGPTAHSNEAYDLGTIQTKVIKRLYPGDKSPEIVQTTLDGATWKLSDHQGRPAVLVFWGERRNAAKEYAAVVNEWVQTGKISALGFGRAYDGAEELKKFIVEQMRPNWPQVDGSRFDLTSTFNSAWPSAVVIDGNGKIVQKDLKPEQLEKCIRDAVDASAKDPRL
jgi:hypothetical protein